MSSNRSLTGSVRKNLKKIGMSGLVVAACAGLFLTQKPKQTIPSQKIAITQIAPHPSLDTIRQGIIDVLTEKGISKDDILFDNAMGNIATATQIAQKFVSESPVVIVPISTASTQAAYGAAKSTGIPVIFSAVSDPEAAKLIPSMQTKGDGITGISDLSPLVEQVDLIQKLLPHLHTLGILYNPGEANSVALIKRLEHVCAERGLTLIVAPVPSTIETTTATQALVGKVEAIYIPTDNTVVSALDAVIKVATTNKIPLFCADPESVGRGCLASLAHNQYQLGRQTGDMIIRFLANKTLPQPEYGDKLELNLNADVAKNLGIELPDELVKKTSRNCLWCTIKQVWEKITQKQARPQGMNVGIIQIVEHPALDQTRAGIIDTLKKHGIAGNIQWQSAQGSPSLALQIAQTYIGQNVAALVTIATSPTQMALAAAKGTNIPIVFASVTDPMGAKVFATPYPISGVSNFIDVEPQIDFFKSILKRDRIRLGVIYNPSEANSVALNEKMEALASKRSDITWVWAPAGKTNDVAQAAESLLDRVDAIFINNDSTALAAFESIVRIAKPHGIPVFCSDVDTVGKGALAALGPNQYDVGVMAGERIVKILKGDTQLAQSQTIDYPRKVETHIDLEMAQSIGLVIPAEIIKKADRVLANTTNTKTVAIVQFVDHPALDIERDAIIKTLEKECAQKPTILYQNAQGSIATAIQIASQFASKKPDVIVAIATPAAQAVLPESQKLGIPLVFTAVTDPVQAKLVKDWDTPDPLVTGVSDALPIEKQIDLIRKMIPHLKTIGLIYNPGEINAVTQVEQIQKIAGPTKIILSPASKSSEVASAVENLVGRVDAILVPNSNTVASAIGSAVAIATKHNVPLFAMDVDLVERGVLAAIGYDRSQLGTKVGQMVCRILSGTPLTHLKVLHDHPLEVRINEEAAKKIGVNTQ